MMLKSTNSDNKKDLRGSIYDSNKETLITEEESPIMKGDLGKNS